MPPCCCDNPCTARTFLQSVLTSNQVMFQVALLRNNLSQKLGEMILQQRNLRTDSFWSELSWFLQAHHMHGMGTDIKECGAVSGDSLCEVASKVANHAKPAQQHAARNILYILENCKSISVCGSYPAEQSQSRQEALKERCHGNGSTHARPSTSCEGRQR
eukprot:TRINITY_DN9252_c0_g1_i2.p1 TRINITY_DN9252_c0_g1~~TRINITY_DN9252_c0_g1_i2.p1  ORF type:complete len:160 (-),score=20.58 TRINITY_DN9252_c0_g1_i2:517-996(-)